MKNHTSFEKNNSFTLVSASFGNECNSWMTVDYELAKIEKKAQLDAGSVIAAGPVGARKN